MTIKELNQYLLANIKCKQGDFLSGSQQAINFKHN